MATQNRKGQRSTKQKKKKLTVKQLRSLVTFLVVANIILLIIVAAFSIYVITSNRKKQSVTALAKPTGDFTVCIDPGHGGSDTGAIGLYDTCEKDGNLKLALKVRDYLEDSGVKVIMTRDADETVSQETRASIANQSDADLFIALHQNYAESREAYGVETWIYSNGSEMNYAIADIILNKLEKVGISKNRGVRTGTQFDSENDYTVIKATNMTSLIIEMGFISNEHDIELFDDNMEDYAKAIAAGTIEWLNQYAD